MSEGNMGNTRNAVTRLGSVVVLTAVVLVACGGDASSDTSLPTTTAAAVATTSEAPPLTTSAPPITTTTGVATTTVPPTPLEALGFPVSDDYIVETVVAGVDAATGGLAIDGDGFFYQADFGYSGHPGDTILKISRDGSVERFAQSDLMKDLTMTVFGPDGTMYQSSYGSNRVFKIDGSGAPEVIAEGLRGPTGIVVGDDGTLFVEAYNSNILHKILPDGTVEDWVSDRRFNGINGLTQGPDGTLYAADHKDGGVFSIDAEGTVEKLFQFPKATSHLVYQDGSLFITSRGAYVVFRYEIATGDIEIIAGNGEAGDQDGRGAESSIGRPNAITIGPDGALYINHGGDGTNNPLSIRKITYQP